MKRKKKAFLKRRKDKGKIAKHFNLLLFAQLGKSGPFLAPVLTYLLFFPLKKPWDRFIQSLNEMDGERSWFGRRFESPCLASFRLM
jgi:hypothetical protein